MIVKEKDLKPGNIYRRLAADGDTDGDLYMLIVGRGDTKHRVRITDFKSKAIHTPYICWSSGPGEERYELTDLTLPTIRTEPTMIKYKYNELVILEDLQVYIDHTYSEHYAQTSYQATEIIIDSGKGSDYCLGNVLKYALRYGRKGGKNRKDLFKILHYTLIAIFIHDRDNKDG